MFPAFREIIGGGEGVGMGVSYGEASPCTVKSAKRESGMLHRWGLEGFCEELKLNLILR